MTMLPAAAREMLTVLLADVRRIHEADLARGFGRVVVPCALDRKFPTAATAWRRQFVFPATRICRDLRFGAPSRYHLHESVVQKAVAHAARLAGTTIAIDRGDYDRQRGYEVGAGYTWAGGPLTSWADDDDRHRRDSG